MRIEWQLVSPFDPELEGFEGEEKGENDETPEPQDETNFEITIESKDGEQGRVLILGIYFFKVISTGGSIGGTQFFTGSYL